jgi:hypothetical protein
LDGTATVAAAMLTTLYFGGLSDNIDIMLEKVRKDEPGSNPLGLVSEFEANIGKINEGGEPGSRVAEGFALPSDRIITTFNLSTIYTPGSYCMDLTWGSRRGNCRFIIY